MSYSSTRWNENTQLAPSENRSTTSADGRVATEAAWLNRKKEKTEEKSKKLLTRFGLLMEGLAFQIDQSELLNLKISSTLATGKLKDVRSVLADFVRRLIGHKVSYASLVLNSLRIVGPSKFIW